MRPGVFEENKLQWLVQEALKRVQGALEILQELGDQLVAVKT